MNTHTHKHPQNAVTHRNAYVLGHTYRHTQTYTCMQDTHADAHSATATQTHSDTQRRAQSQIGTDR